jgi:hypothetical protein
MGVSNEKFDTFAQDVLVIIRCAQSDESVVNYEGKMTGKWTIG